MNDVRRKLLPYTCVKDVLYVIAIVLAVSTRGLYTFTYYKDNFLTTYYRRTPIMYITIATDKANNLNGQFYTLAVFYVIRREIIVATTLSVLLLRRVNVLHVVSPDTTSSCALRYHRYV